MQLMPSGSRHTNQHQRQSFQEKLRASRCVLERLKQHQSVQQCHLRLSATAGGRQRWKCNGCHSAPALPTEEKDTDSVVAKIPPGVLPSASVLARSWRLHEGRLTNSRVRTRTKPVCLCSVTTVGWHGASFCRTRRLKVISMPDHINVNKVQMS